MRSLHVIADLNHGGAQTQLRLLAEAALGRGESVAVACLRRPVPVAERLRKSGIEVFWVGRRFRIDPLATVQLLRLMRRWRPEVIQSWDEASAAFCRAVRRLSGTPWVQVLRGPSERPAGADVVMAADELTAEQAGTSAIVVPNAFDPTISPTDAATKRSARDLLRSAGADISDSAPVVAVVARIDQPQAVNELVWAADLARVVCPGLRVVVVGEGPALMACQRFAAQAVEPGLIVWLGAWQDLATVYAAADLVWCGAGQGAAPTPAIEALAAGKPLVLADAPGRELIVPQTDEVGSAGLRPRWDDRAGWARSTKRLFEDTELATRIGRENAERVREPRSAVAVAALHEQVVRSAVGARSTMA